MTASRFTIPLLSSLAGVFLAATAWGSEQGATKQPKIGLALEGGGALGLAHIGVLEWFEEHHIPIDYIAGTSMGGLIGGIYSTGLPAGELRKLVADLDWSSMLSGRPVYKDLGYRRKEDLRAFQNYLEFGLRHGFDAPGGLNSGQEITFLLDKLTLPYSEVKFDALPIPFRCVAADLVTGKPHVFTEGPLGTALRATMSLPAIFTPVMQDGRYYADGGLLNNLPVDVVKQMGADIVIAVTLKPSPFDPQNSQSMFGVMGRSIGVMIEANEVRNAEMADILISANLTGFTSADFTAGEKIVVQGYDGAARKSTLLSRLAVDDGTWDRIVKDRESRRRTAKTPEFVVVEGVDPSAGKAIEHALADQVGEPIVPERLERSLNLMPGRERFSSFDYRLTEVNGRPGLAVRADENSYSPPFLKLGISIDGADPNNVLFTATARATVLDVAGFGSEWRTDVSVGSTWGLSSELYRPLSPGNLWFVAPRAYASNSPFDLYSRSERIADYRVHRYGGGIDVGYAIDRFSQLRIGYDLGYLDSSLRVGQPTLPTPAGRFGSASIRYELDRLDSPVIPRQGQAINARFAWTDESPGAAHGFPVAELSLTSFLRVSKPASVYAQALGGSTFGHNDTGLPQFFLGGPGRLAAYGINELRTNQYFLGRVGYVHELFNLPPLIGNKVYFMSAFELGKTYGSTPSGITLSSRLPVDGTVSLVTDTLFGPLAVGTGVGDTGHREWFFRLGRIF
jgi:NTE family protein